MESGTRVIEVNTRAVVLPVRCAAHLQQVLQRWRNSCSCTALWQGDGMIQRALPVPSVELCLVISFAEAWFSWLKKNL